MGKKYYIQSIKHGGYVGNCVLWWRKNSQGYTVNIDEAQSYTEEEARKICEHYPSDYKVWNKEYIDSIVSMHVDGNKLGTDKKNYLTFKKNKHNGG